MKQINLYSDGSSLGNPGPGGWGTILEYKGKERELCGGREDTTNNQMELLGVIEGLKALKEPCDVTIISDSSYVVKGINEWLKSWIKNNWKTAAKKPVKNVDLWQEYVKVSKSHKINALWVKGHDGHEYNERCDILARSYAEKLKGE
ncbi:ribonuclease HI [Halarcobacter anaerophilus]|jgi:ribonuclease HI|uniref:Ribonuclease H n=1 Tax=Halarcobacter anaerophilus TaxID=877500 RepID=A0A4Q0XYA3_9BACT|nr:ribonuclease HI [Halarcobacter anaerophilus]QDF29692.1 ribonuclease HI [Halarcobacter anaerophilus]RXJ62617.1 ribonuclease HI [Halarcobacter anaerophilus]